MSRLVEDSVLRLAFKNGTPEALAEVYREYARGLYTFVQQKLRARQGGAGVGLGFEADNIVQETFMRAFAASARQAYDGLRPYRNYLFTIAQNLVIDEQRRRLAETRLVQKSESEPDPGESSMEQEAFDREVTVLAKKFIAELSQEDRRIFKARFEEGHAVEDCASMLGLSEYRIKRDEKRLRKQFFHYMKQEGYFDGYSQAHLLAAALLLLAQGTP